MSELRPDFTQSGTFPTTPACRAVSTSAVLSGAGEPSAGCWANSAAWKRRKASLAGLVSAAATQ